MFLVDVPQCQDSEQAVIAALIIEGCKTDKVILVLESLSQEDFYNQLHQQIFAEIKSLFDRKAAIDLTTLSSRLPAAKAYIIELCRNSSGYANIGYYANTVKEKSDLRRKLDALNAAFNCLTETGKTYQEQVDAMESALTAIDAKSTVAEVVTMENAVLRHVEVLQSRMNSDAPMGLSTGFSGIDKYIGGMRGGQLITLGARTSVGKSALGLNIAESVAVNHKTLYVTMEMPVDELAERAICSQGRLDNSKVKSMRELSTGDWTSLNAGASRSSTLKISMIEMSRPNINQIKGYARAVNRSSGLDFLVIDHLHLMSLNNRLGEVQGLAEITAELKGLALELNIPILLMAQLNRGNAKENRWPEITDLRGSGAIEQDSDIVMLLHRNDDDDDLRGKAALLIKKNRGGEKDVIVILANNLKYYRFDNYANLESY